MAKQAKTKFQVGQEKYEVILTKLSSEALQYQYNTYGLFLAVLYLVGYGVTWPSL